MESQGRGQQVARNKQSMVGGLKRFLHTPWGRIVSVFSVLASVVTVLTFVLQLFGVGNFGNPSDSSDPNNGEKLSSPLTSSGLPSSFATSSSFSYIPVGTCGSYSSGKFREIPCDAPHMAEIIATAPECGMGAFLKYAGGNSEIDVLRVDINLQTLEASCVAQAPDLQLEESFEGVLDREDGSALRECYMDRTGSYVPCAERHTGEVIFREDPVNPTDLECETRAEEYMGTTLERIFPKLKIVSTANSPRRCIVEVRGNNTLEGSLRNQGPKAIDLKPGT